MGRSSKIFNRWKSHEPSSWSFHLYLQYNSELVGLQTAHSIASAKVYRDLGASGVEFTDKSKVIFGNNDKYISRFPTLKDWSNGYNSFDNWINLSSALTAASNLETYLASVIRLAIESDPGVLIGASRAVDGAMLLKSGGHNKLEIETHIKNCTKGNWSARLGAFEKIFGAVPDEVRAEHANLEKLRCIRNRFGHAFGRDIEQARRTGIKSINKIEKLSRENSDKLRNIATKVAKNVDHFLLENHVGDFEVVQFYAATNPSVAYGKHVSERAVALKKSIGRIGAVPRGNDYCRSMIRYWDALP